MFVQVRVTLERGSKMFSHVPSSATPSRRAVASPPTATITQCGRILVFTGSRKPNGAPPAAANGGRSAAFPLKCPCGARPEPRPNQRSVPLGSLSVPRLRRVRQAGQREEIFAAQRGNNRCASRKQTDPFPEIDGKQFANALILWLPHRLHLCRQIATRCYARLTCRGSIKSRMT